ncbi:MAG TPA: glycosyltransferase family 9 protein [Chitinophaga sp.]|uniref:glycosyltransferase family 9 protein n=1 Tax=Chitinophaga sp. TaxID=1869181 RepID=UPI002DBD4EFD|nr:glycosyltransferase family 9 protein [Chitinophaga sp.]HEU4551938.1 glycosyltransferase family 9 protein [Chitinophaga sp.]
MTIQKTISADWQHCKRILCIRLDNMGDLLMSEPALRALKQSLGCHLTLLTSSMAQPLAASIPEIDDVLLFDAPWVKTNTAADSSAFNNLVQQLANGKFDGAVVFTVYSQNPMPAIMLAYLARIPLRLAYCRENPYGLLTHWVPEKEPYAFIHHQVQRDLDLVKNIGAVSINSKLNLQVNESLWPGVQQQLQAAGANPHRPWLLLHAGVSERKRQYPGKDWIAIGHRLREALPGHQLVFTGVDAEKEWVQGIVNGIGPGAFSVVGQLTLEAFITLIRHSLLLLSVNTSAAHFAAAVGTPEVILYAKTNPQHTPWQAHSRVLYFDVPTLLQSNNEVIRFACREFDKRELPAATVENAVQAVLELLGKTGKRRNGEAVTTFLQ